MNRSALGIMARAAAVLWSATVFTFLALPTTVVIIMSFSGAGTQQFPPPSFSLRWYEVVLRSAPWRDSFALSTVLAAIVTVLSLMLAVPVSYAIARHRFPGRDVLLLFLLSPLMVAQIVLGIGLLYFFNEVNLVDTVPGLVFAHTIVALPFVVRAVHVSALSLDPNLERAAAVLGAGFWRAFRDVVMPSLRPGIVAGAVFAVIISFGEAELSIFLSGIHNVPVPVRVFGAIEYTISPELSVVSTVLIWITIPGLFLLDRYVGLSKLM